jgi:putative oxidoreductase
MTLGLLLLRVVVGLTLAAHGSQKLFGWFGGGGIEGTGAFFESRLGFRPGRVAALGAGLGEFGGGLLLALGFFTPFGSAAVIGVMLVAAVSAHLSSGFFITQGGYEYTLVLATVAASLAFVGPGRVSIDRAIGWDLHGTLWGIAAIILGGIGGMAVLATRGRLGAEPEAEPATTEVAGGREAGLERADTTTEIDVDAR